MKQVRLVLSVVLLGLLVAGYGVSQYAVMTGTAASYAQTIDCPPVQWIALAFLIACIVFAFMKDPEANEK